MSTPSEPRTPRPHGDDGFTLIEVLVAVAIIAVVMLGLGAVFVATASGTDAQGLRQTAVRVATDGLDRVRGLGADVVKGRTTAVVGTSWPSAVATRLAGLPVATDPAATGAAPSLPLQTTQTVDGLVYTRSFFVAGCHLTPAGACLAAATTGTVPMYDVVVAVAWRHKSCPSSACSYQLSTLVAASVSEPLFNDTVKAAAPTIATQALQVLDKGETVNGPTVTVAGGNGSVSVKATGLPPGIEFNPATMSFTGTADAVTPGTVATVSATDQFDLVSTTQITFIVNPLPTVTAAAVTLTTGLTSTVDLASVLGLAGGTRPVTWNCGTLAPGLTLDAKAGTLTALLPAIGVLTPTCTVTDARNRTASARITLNALAPLTVTTPTNSARTTVKRLAAVRGQLVATGCSGTCTWQPDTLPAGVTLTTGGLLGGAPTALGTTTTVFTVTDGAGRTATSTLTWTVTA